MHLDFYFDFISPYAYLAWRRLRTLSERDGFEVRAHPVLFAGLLKHWGQLGPAEIPPKRAFTFRDVFRFAARHSIPMTFPAAHPFNPLVALRASLASVAGEHQARVVDAIYRLGWENGGDIGDAKQIADALVKAGVPSDVLEKAASPSAKDALRAATDEAIALGVFGVPTYVADGEVFWGNDRLDDALAKMRGEDPLSPAAFQALLDKMPIGAERKR